MNHSTCGYNGHYCSRGVQFISRYRDANDYCVGGERIRVFDGGTVRYGNPRHYRKILLFELDKYADYAKWNAKHRAKDPTWPVLSEFKFAGLARFARTEGTYADETI